MSDAFDEIRKSMKHAKILYCPTCRIQCDPKSGYCAKCGKTNHYEWAEGYTKAILDFNIFLGAKPESFDYAKDMVECGEAQTELKL